MKHRIATVVCLILITVLLCTSASAAAPVLPTRNFYVNDHAAVITSGHRDSMLVFSNQIREETGADLVVLTVTGLQGLSMEEFGALTMEEWEIGGPEQNGLLILVDASKPRMHIAVGSGLSPIIESALTDELTGEVMPPYFNGGNYTGGIFAVYKRLALTVYEGYGLQPNEELAKQLNKRGMASPTTALVVVAFMAIVMGRSFRVSHKYRKKYGKRYTPPRRSFVTQREQYDDIAMKTGGTRRDPTAYATDPTIRREGFIIYRDEDTTFEKEETD